MIGWFEQKEGIMSAQERTMLETTLYNLRYDMNCIGKDLWSEIAAISDRDLEILINEYVEEYE